MRRRALGRAALLLVLLGDGELSPAEACWGWRRGDLPRLVVQALDSRGETYNGFKVSREYFGAFALDGLAVALWAVHHSDSVMGAIAKAANVLGDADSTACIAGQLAGAYYGDAGLDERALQALRTWDPEREIDPAAIEKRDSPYLRKLADVRSLQIGLRDTAWAKFYTDRAYVLCITDLTASFRAAHDALKSGDLDAARAALWPSAAMHERRLDPSPELVKTIQIQR